MMIGDLHGKEAKMGHFMGIINQRNKSKREKKFVVNFLWRNVQAWAVIGSLASSHFPHNYKDCGGMLVKATFGKQLIITVAKLWFTEFGQIGLTHLHDKGGY